MWIPFAARKPEGRTPEAAEPPAPRRKKRRRAATSMEYVVAASFILLVIIAAIQGFGFSVAKLFTADAAATSKAQPPGK
jgi:Flp pilus assembly pilin Flp